MGLLVAATPGPIFFLCLSRTLRRGWRHGLASGLGIATADACYAGLAALGLGLVLDSALGSHRRWLDAAAAVFLILLAFVTVRRGAVPPQAVPATSGALSMEFSSIFLMTAANPLTMTSFAALLTGLGPAPASGLASLAIGAGAFVGSAVWWLLLVFAATRVRALTGERMTRGLNVLAAGVTAALGLRELLAAVLG